MPVLNYEQERELVWQSLAEANRDVSVNFGFASSDRLRSVFTKRPKVVHFSGHGNSKYLSVEDGQGGLHALGTPQLRSLCSAGDNSRGIQLVFVSACFSQFAGEAFAEAGIPHVVAVDVMEGKLMDKAAQAFTRAFYLSICVGDNVQSAFDIAKEAVVASPNLSLTGEEESRKFLLLGKGDHANTSIFKGKVVKKRSWQRPPSVYHETTQRLWKGYRPRIVPEEFLGREVDTYLTLLAISSRRFVTISGEAGVGKTLLLASVENYLNERLMFPRWSGVH